jgi:heptosyltransferase-2
MALYKFLLEIRQIKYDIVVDVYGKPESNIIVAFSVARKKIGFYKWYTSLFYTHTIKEISKPVTNAGLALENRLNLVKFLNPKIELNNRPKIYLTPDEITNGRKILDQYAIDLSKKIFMISVLGSGPNKTYPSVYMAQILDFIAQHMNGTLLFNYMPSQAEDAKKIFEQTQKSIRMDVGAKGIREFLSITHHCNALIGNEGGAVNMAKALNIPTFTIFSPWIKKEAWNSFENETDTVSVHLKDFKPELYNGKSPKEMKNDSLKLYESFTPDLILPTLEKYLESI